MFLPAILLPSRAPGPIRLTYDGRDNSYTIEDVDLGWKLSGKIEGTVIHVDINAENPPKPHQTTMTIAWNNGAPLESTIRYDDRYPVIRFSTKYLEKTAKPVAFPNFTSFPGGLHPFSYKDEVFSPATYSLFETSTPWLLFDDKARAMVFSPDSHFQVAKMVGDGKASIGASLNSRLNEVPAGFTQGSILVFGQGIGKTWDSWGSAMRSIYHRPIAPQSSDVLLRKFGYWTDNGADYYYNYDPKLGYAGTLLALRDRYRKEGIPLGYMQLDSWWYQKSIDSASGHPGPKTKNPKLPAGTWNRYGGTLIYRASPDLFPDGLAAFQHKLGLPLAVHGRWIDKNSPDRATYRFSGVASIDPKWWTSTADYLKSSGVTCYEQDWLNVIYANSPEMFEKPGVGRKFTDAMAGAAAANGMTMQYCMATPRYFLQGLEYPNLTTIRVSDDRFLPARWQNFLYTSQLAREIGAWPWCDVFKSGESGNMILSVLSAGPVGTGDAMGKEDKANILAAARPDGILVKPDHPIVPCDQTYLQPDKPFVASTFTDHNGWRTSYVFAFPRSKGGTDMASIDPGSLGYRGPVYVIAKSYGAFLDPRLVRPGEQLPLPAKDYSFWEVSPVTSSGIAFFGDLGKFVGTGKQRIRSITPVAGGLKVVVEFALGEGAVTLAGISPTKPHVQATRGTASLSAYDPASKLFRVKVAQAKGIATVLIRP